LHVNNKWGGLERAFENGFEFFFSVGATHARGFYLLVEMVLDEIGMVVDRGVVWEDDCLGKFRELTHGEARAEITNKERVFVGEVVFC
jgi:hypothetical protein